MKFRHYFLFALLLAASLICFWALGHIILGVPFLLFSFDTIVFFEGMVGCVAFGLIILAARGAELIKKDLMVDVYFVPLIFFIGFVGPDFALIYVWFFGLFWIALIASILRSGEGESSANNMLAAMSLVTLFGRR